MPVGFPSFREALRAGTEIFHALRAILKKRGPVHRRGRRGRVRAEPEGQQGRARRGDGGDRQGRVPGRRRRLHRPRLSRPASSATPTGRYEFHKSGEPGRDSEGMVALYEDWCRQYPILSIEDGCAEGDWRGWKLLTQALGGRCSWSATTSSSPTRRSWPAASPRASATRCWSSSTRSAPSPRRSTRSPWRRRPATAASSRTAPARPRTRPSPTWRWARPPGQIKTGSASRSDRVAKYNQLLRIEEALGDGAVYAGRGAIAQLGLRVMYRVVLLRHGESTWNRENRFTGWVDVDLSEKGLAEAHARRPAAEGRRLHLRRRLHVAAEAGHPHAVDRAGRARPAVDSGASLVAAQRAALRRPAGAEQGRDGRQARRGPGQDLAAQLRHPAAAADARRSAVSRAAIRATPDSRAGRAAADRVPQGHGRPLPALLARDDRAGDPRRPAGDRSPRTATACARWSSTSTA